MTHWFLWCSTIPKKNKNPKLDSCLWPWPATHSSSSPLFSKSISGRVNMSTEQFISTRCSLFVSSLPGGLVLVLSPIMWEVLGLNPRWVRKGLWCQTSDVDHSTVVTLNREHLKWKVFLIYCHMDYSVLHPPHLHISSSLQFKSTYTVNPDK